MPSPGAELLRVQDLSVSYGDAGRRVLAARGISFRVAPGEIAALVGESGSGKSSVALALTRLLPSPPAQVSGSVLFEGRDLLALPEPDLRRVRGAGIAYVFQDPATSLNPVLTIGEQLREMVELHSDRRGRAADAVAVEWLSRVGIASPAQRLRAYPHEFSGGMQQRVMIAMAMAAHPSLLIADEPTTALDVTVQVQILRLMRDLQRRLGLAVLLISHDLLIVQRLAQQVHVLSQGQIVESGSVAQVFTHPEHSVTKALLACRPPVALRQRTARDG
jgi:microcin C transport system ATP-binding protein